ncbi:general transcription factor IIF subunit 1 [Topomyia yanbarensis]|uniref:general transcription factor IIF subunit 1 n=1 Tax=Topomyia yanbarensis TaxID=2498891 RepID=UPI00273A777E|nr:general transcription factor IIF subunit 1 [Topomyia yanbarensis]
MSGPSSHPSASSSAAGGGGSSSGPPVSVQEFSIRVPKNLKKKHHVMRFNATLNVDFTQWRSVKMERENNLKEFKGFDEDMPKFGAGSEFNRDLREEARRKRYGIIAKKYRPEAQPWILKAGGKKDGKKFRGIREGGVGENAAFYVFTHAPDGAIEAYPLHEWYNFQSIQRYKALSAEEAEQEFSKRKKVMNYFSLMLRKRMKGDDDTVEDPEETKAKKGGAGKAKDLKISDMDEWIDSDDMSSSDDDDDEGKPKEKDSDDEADKKAKNKKKALAESKKKKRDVDEEALEESDDGDEEGRELDYISDSSESESEPEGKANKELKSVAEEDALRKLLTSDEDSEDDDKKSDEEENKKEEEKNAKSKEKEKDAKEKESKDSKKKKKNKKKKAENDKKDSSSGSSTDSSDSDGDNSNSKHKKKHKKDKEGFASNLSSANNSRSASPSMSQLEASKRKMAGSNMPTADLTGSDNSNSPISTPAKKAKMDSALALPPTFTGLVSSNSKDDYGITEEAVRRYLMRKPMTTTELLTKFKNKKTGVSSEKLVETMTAILKKINPVKQTIQGKMYLSIKVPK